MFADEFVVFEICFNLDDYKPSTLIDYELKGPDRLVPLSGKLLTGHSVTQMNDFV